MLGTPPAFVLSQDQTLRTIVLISASSCTNLINSELALFRTLSFAITAFDTFLVSSTDKTLLNLIGFLTFVVV